MMRSHLLWLLIALVALPSGALAGSSAANAHIKKLQINKGYGVFVFINIDVVPTGAPACESGTWQYTLSLTNPGDSQMYAMLLTAYTTGAPVDLGGTGACSDVGFVESLSAVQLTQ
jgi:hypothetical protein